MPPCGAPTVYRDIEKDAGWRCDRLGSAMITEQVSDESPGAALPLIDLVCGLRHATHTAKQPFDKQGDYKR